MSDTTATVYAIYYSVQTGPHAPGYVWNNVLWNGDGSLSLPEGSASVADPDRKYPIGSAYTAPTA